ncbi:MAG: hypothetical protein MUF61_03535 [archaeon]|nr:hypothetical protein [archaeon]
MEIPILELVTQIMEKGKFVKSKQSDDKLRTHMESLFKLHNKEKSQASARMIYSGVVDLARLGKGELAHKYALKFEEEVGYDELGELN